MNQLKSIYSSPFKFTFTPNSPINSGNVIRDINSTSVRQISFLGYVNNPSFYWEVLLSPLYHLTYDVCTFCIYYILTYILTYETFLYKFIYIKCICLTSVTRAKCGTRSTLCWKIGNISGSTELFAL